MKNFFHPPLLFISMAPETGSLETLEAPVPILETPAPGEDSSPAQLVEALHTTFGNHHARAVHAKGIVLEGNFHPDPAAASITTAFHLQQEASKIIVRFSDFTGIPDIPDNIGAANPRGLSIKFIMPDGRTTDIVGHSFNGFPTSDSDQFRELLLAIAASGPSGTIPNALDSFLAGHPVAKTFLTTQKLPASYASISYFGVNSFRFTNEAGISHIVRYQFIPEEGELFLTPDEYEKAGPEYLMNDIRERISKHPVRFKMLAEIAEALDRIEDPSIAFPEGREKILLGYVVMDKVAANTPEEDRALFFTPDNIPDGIETADPMISFRSKAYPISVKERQ